MKSRWHDNQLADSEQTFLDTHFQWCCVSSLTVNIMLRVTLLLLLSLPKDESEKKRIRYSPNFWMRNKFCKARSLITMFVLYTTHYVSLSITHSKISRQNLNNWLNLSTFGFTL